MNKTLSVSLLLLLVACDGAELSTDGQSSDEITLYAEIENGGMTKTLLSPEWDVLWQEGDALAVFIDGNTNPSICSLKTGAGTASGTFTGAGSGSSYIAVYPSSVLGDVTDVNRLSVNLPQEQTYKGGSFGSGSNIMYAKSDGTNLQFRNVCSVLKLSITGHHAVQEIVFEAMGTGVKVSGPGAITVDRQGRPVLEMAAAANNTVTLNVGGEMLSESKATDFFMVLPAQTYKGGFSVTVRTDAGTMTKTVTSDVTLDRSKIHEASAFSIILDDDTDYYVSSDYSKDGEVTAMFTATEGVGINLVLMGDGFSDRQIADGTYRSAMIKMMEAFFSVEPYTTLRPMFNAYYVNVVSQTEGYDHEGQKLETWFGSGTQVGGNDQTCMNYARNVIDDSKMDDVLIIVAMNSDRFGGTCYMYYSSAYKGDYGQGTSVAYFPMGTSDEELGMLVHHEAGGHGFAKLADEYWYSGSGSIPQSQIDSRMGTVPLGWWKNCDFTGDPATVKWHHFLEDARYDNDGLGCFEGGFTYEYGVWRPTDNSILRYNTGGFNAPSREAIWYRAHKLAHGEDWRYDYEGFVAYDAKNRNNSVVTKARGALVERYFTPTHPPVVIPRPWNEK